MYVRLDPYRGKATNVARLCSVLERRAAEPQQQALRKRLFKRSVAGLSNARVVEVSCSAGARAIHVFSIWRAASPAPHV